MKYQGCFMQVSWIGSFKVVSRKFQESFKGVLREFWGSFKGVSKKFWGWFKEVLELFRLSFHGVFRKFQGCFNKFSVWKFKGCVESIKRGFQETFRGVFKGVWSKLQKSVSKKLLKCMEILKVFQRIFKVFWESFMGAAGRFLGCSKSVSQVLQAFSAELFFTYFLKFWG